MPPTCSAVLLRWLMGNPHTGWPLFCSGHLPGTTNSRPLPCHTLNHPTYDVPAVLNLATSNKTSLFFVVLTAIDCAFPPLSLHQPAVCRWLTSSRVTASTD